MNAKDTVMTLGQLNEIPDWDSLELTPVLKAQAEISFKAGIKEVVDWMMENYPEVCDSHLEAKLKDWGIDEIRE